MKNPTLKFYEKTGDAVRVEKRFLKVTFDGVV